MNEDSKIYVAGHAGMVGSAICRQLEETGYENVVVRDRSQLDLTRENEVLEFFHSERPDYVFLAAAKVGGIHANRTYPAEFLEDNLRIQNAVISGAWRAGTEKLLFLGSSCIYPRAAEQPISEDSLLTGPLEETNEWYAIAKIAGIKLCDAYRRQHGFNAISVMPTNLYGPGDSFNLETSHVVPALIRKFFEAVRDSAATVQVWGSGRPLREFMHVDDLAAAVLFLMDNYDEAGIINIGSGQEVSIAELATMVAGIAGFDGEIVFDSSMPDGTPRKLLCRDKLETLGWRPQYELEQGLRSTYEWYVARQQSGL